MTHSFTSISLIYAMALERARFRRDTHATQSRDLPTCFNAMRYARNAPRRASARFDVAGDSVS